MNHLINSKAVKELALAVSKHERNGRFTRVSAEFLQHINEQVRVIVTGRVKRHPSLGVTLK